MSPLLAESDTVMSSLTTDCNVGGKLEPLNKPVRKIIQHYISISNWVTSVPTLAAVFSACSMKTRQHHNSFQLTERFSFVSASHVRFDTSHSHIITTFSVKDYTHIPRLLQINSVMETQ